MDIQEFIRVNGICIENWVFDVIKVVEKELQANSGKTLYMEKQRELLQNIATEVVKIGTAVNIPWIQSSVGSTSSIMNQINNCGQCGSIVPKPYGKFEIAICKCGEHFKE